MLLFFRLRLHHGPSYLRSKIFFWIIFYFFCEKNVVSLLKLIALYEIKYVIRVSIRLIVTITIIIIIIHENKRNWIFTYLRSLLARKVMLHTWKQLKKVIVWQMQRQTYPLKIYCVVSTFLWLSSWQSTVLLILIYMASNEWKNPVHERGNQAF